MFSFPWVLWIALTPYILCKFQLTTVWIFGYCIELLKGTQVHSDYKFIHSNWFVPACVHRWCISWRWWRWSNRPSPSRACNTSSDCKGGDTHPGPSCFGVFSCEYHQWSTQANNVSRVDWGHGFWSALSWRLMLWISLLWANEDLVFGIKLYDFVTFMQTIGEVLPFNRERVATMVIRDVSEQISWFLHMSVGTLLGAVGWCFYIFHFLNKIRGSGMPMNGFFFPIDSI